MKKINYYFPLFLLLILSSCVKDQNEIILSEEGIESSGLVETSPNLISNSSIDPAVEAKAIEGCGPRMAVDWFNLSDSYLSPAVAPVFRKYVQGELDEEANDCKLSDDKCAGASEIKIYEVFLGCKENMFSVAEQDAIIATAKTLAIQGAPSCSMGEAATPVFYDFFLDHSMDDCMPPFGFNGIIFVQVQYCCPNDGGADEG